MDSGSSCGATTTTRSRRASARSAPSGRGARRARPRRRGGRRPPALPRAEVGQAAAPVPRGPRRHPGAPAAALDRAREPAQRYRQELSFMLSQIAATPFLRRPDVLVSASPSFPALLPAMLNARLRGARGCSGSTTSCPTAPRPRARSTRARSCRHRAGSSAAAYRAARPDRRALAARSPTTCSPRACPSEKIEPDLRPRHADARRAGAGARSPASCGSSDGQHRPLAGTAASRAGFDGRRSRRDDVRLAITGIGRRGGRGARRVGPTAFEMLGLRRRRPARGRAASRRRSPSSPSSTRAPSSTSPRSS